jgi:hypothetical protein
VCDGEEEVEKINEHLIKYAINTPMLQRDLTENHQKNPASTVKTNVLM